MQNCHLITEMGGKGLQHLRSQRNLRDQEYGALSPFQLLLDQMNIHAGLSASSYTEKQSCACFPLLGKTIQTVKSLFLLGVQLRECLSLHILQIWPAIDLSRIQLDHFRFAERFQGLPGCAGHMDQVFTWQRFKTAQHVQKLRLHGGTSLLCFRKRGSILGRDDEPGHLHGLVLYPPAPIIIEPESGR